MNLKLTPFEAEVSAREGVHTRPLWLGVTLGIGAVSSRRDGERCWRMACGAELIGTCDAGRVEWSLLFEQGAAITLTRAQAAQLLRQTRREAG